MERSKKCKLSLDKNFMGWLNFNKPFLIYIKNASKGIKSLSREN